MDERETLMSQLALAEASYHRAKELHDHDSAALCAETMANVNRRLHLIDEQARKLREEGAVV